MLNEATFKANISVKMEDMPFEKMENIEPIKKSKLTVGRGREYPIKITNLISPSSFYFKLENLMGTMEMDISEILKKEAAKLQPIFPSGYVPNERETVMVYGKIKEKMNRCVIKTAL